MRGDKTSSDTMEPISLAEMNNAESDILKYVQRKYFSDEIASLQNSANSNTVKLKKSSSIFRLDPVIVNGLLCVGGRLRKSELSSDAKHQVILPKMHPVTDLLIKHHH